MTVLAPAAWWRGLGGLTRSGSSIEALADRWGPRKTLFAVLGTWAVGLVILTFLSTIPAIASLFVLLLIGIWILRGVPEGKAAVEALIEEMSR